MTRRANGGGGDKRPGALPPVLSAVLRRDDGPDSHLPTTAPIDYAAIGRALAAADAARRAARRASVRPTDGVRPRVATPERVVPRVVVRAD